MAKIVNKSENNDQSIRKFQVSSIQKEVSVFLESIGCKEQHLLIELWRNWITVMGTNISSIAAPLGRRDTVLLIGGEDTMALQELMFMRAEILERANVFMDSVFFSSVEVKLCMGLVPLNKKVLITKKTTVCSIQIPNLSVLGKSVIKDMDTPIGKCYKAYLAMCDVERNK